MSLAALMLVPPIAGVLLVSTLSWYLHNEMVDRFIEMSASWMSTLIHETSNAPLSYFMSVENKKEVNRALSVLTRSPSVFAAEVRNVDGGIIARYQNPNLPLKDGIQIRESREKLYYIMDGEDPADEEDRALVGEVLYQLTPSMMHSKTLKLQTQYRYLLGCLVLLVILSILLAAHYTLKPIREICEAINRLALGENDTQVNTNSIAREMRVIQSRVNQLASSLRDSSRSLSEKEAVLEERREFDRHTESVVGASAKGLSDPLQVIVEQLRVNCDAKPGAKGKQLIDPKLILESAEELQVTLLAMMGKLSELRVSSDLTEITLEDYFQGKRNQYDGRFRLRGLELLEQSKSEMDSSIYKFDVRLVDIVLGKVLENALMYTREGMATLEWSVESTNGVHRLSIVVRDTGRGIEKREMEHVFEAFWRSADVMSEGVPGNGLGLYIAQEIAVTLGGSISVESEVSYGSRFNITLPIERQEHNTGGLAKTALLIGVKSRDRKAINRVLVEQKMVVIHADTSIEGLVMMSDQAFDFMIADESISNPSIDTLIENIKKLEMYVEIGVITAARGRYGNGIQPIERKNREAGLIALLTPKAGPLEQVAAPVDYTLKKRFEVDRDAEKNGD